MTGLRQANGTDLPQDIPPSVSGRIRQRYRVVYEAIKPLNGVKLLACLTDVLKRMVSGRTKANELEGLPSWKWKSKRLVNVVGV